MIKNQKFQDSLLQATSILQHDKDLLIIQKQQNLERGLLMHQQVHRQLHHHHHLHHHQLQNHKFNRHHPEEENQNNNHSKNTKKNILYD